MTQTLDLGHVSSLLHDPSGPVVSVCVYPCTLSATTTLESHKLMVMAKKLRAGWQKDRQCRAREERFLFILPQ